MRPVPVENPPNPWAHATVEWLGEPPETGLKVYEDRSRTILSQNDSPDVPFRWSVNPYRGCFHGCAYCYARPTHEYLGFGAGSDFERAITVKPEAPALLRAAFEARSWKGETVVFSGVTDCYQPLEAAYRLTRGCLEVCADYRNPIGIITKSPLIERDVDLLVRLAEVAHVRVGISIAFQDEAKARALEPWVTTPARRMRTIERLAAAGIEVGVMVAPIIPGLSDEDVPRVLMAAREAGASWAGHVMLRLPGSVREVFEARLRKAFPLRVEKVLARTREMRGGGLNDPRFGSRMRGEGEYAGAIDALFHSSAARAGFPVRPREPEPESETTFRRPTDKGGQLRLFDG